MKAKFLPLVLVLLFIAPMAKACPSYIIGQIKVVDENNNVVTNAKIWKYSSLNDSFQLRKWWGYYEYENTDTNYYNIWSSGGWRGYYEDDNKAADKCFRITADGYTEVIIKQLTWDWNWSDTTMPTLIVTLYAQKYRKANNSITLYDNFWVTKPLEIKDTVRLMWQNYMGDAAQNSAPIAEATTKVTTYPNPVVKGLHIKINYAITSPLRARMSDAQGRLVDEITIENAEIDWDMQWHAKGNYFLTIYDEGNKVIHTQLIAKM
jgi:hypothetical protein